MTVLTCEELHLTDCKFIIAAAVLVHQHFLSVEVDIDADILVTS